MRSMSPTSPSPGPRDALRQRLGCPRCGGPVRRRRRSLAQRWVKRGASMGRYRCADHTCGWTGLLSRDLAEAQPDDPQRPPAPRWRAWRGLVPLALASFAVLAAQWGAGFAPVADVSVGGRLFAPGEAFDGESLPEDHPLLVPAAHLVVASEGPAAAPETLAPGSPNAPSAGAPAPAGLSLRRFCAWGHPGRMPYRGTVQQALSAARLPEEVREQIGAAIAAGRPLDRLVISNSGIRGVTGAREFEPQGIAMVYGRTLCLGTRVNFKLGHTEPASLYEAFDKQGRRHSVMVPDVCGNVSVLRPREGRPPEAPDDPTDPLDPGAPPRLTTIAGGPGTPNEVPLPGTLALSLLALAALAAARRVRGGLRPAA